MSNYAIGYLFINESGSLDQIVGEVRSSCRIGFHIIDSVSDPLVSMLPQLPNQVFFCLSDSNNVLVAEELLFETDWSDDADMHVPKSLVGRINAIVKAIELLFDMSKSCEIGLWLSQNDQMDSEDDVSLRSLTARICADFLSVGVPCVLYKIKR